VSIKPTLRSDAEWLLKSQLIPAISAIKSFGYIYKSCLNCEHFDELNGEICKLAKARPPARVIAYACERWVDMEIPF
jgi:hypothetical protein